MSNPCENCGGDNGKHSLWCYNNRGPLPTEPARSHDMVDNPAHYTSGSIECIDYMQDVLSADEFRGYLRGQVIKYQHRLMAKGNPAQDAAKLAWYANRLAALKL